MLALLLFLVALPAGAATSFTTTNWVAAVPVPGILCTNGLGQVYLKGNVHVHRVVSAEARIAGRLQAWMDLAYQSNGTAIFGGPAYAELGTWDPAGTNFTPSGGVWDMKYSGVVQADGSDQLHLVGYGIGGAIDGLRVELTATKGPGAPFDPTVPYVSSGTIKPAPVNTSVVVDDFAAGPFNWPLYGAGTGTFTATKSNQQLTLGGTWRSPTWNLSDTTAWAALYRNWSVPDGQTIEVRVDLVSLNQSVTAAALGLYHADGQAYILTKAANWIAFWKQNSALACFRADRVTTSNTNSVLVLALTPVGQNVVLTGKVLDKQSGTVLYQTNVVDTPASDPTLSQAQLAQLTGCRVWHDFGPDPAGAPWKNGNSFCLLVGQDTDGTLPAAAATFDNLELRTYEVPQIAIERAMRITWPATSGSYAVEAAPSVQGPWLPANDQLPPGVQQMTFPANGSMMFWRLIQAP
jgi:hypothetical protein